MPQQQDTPPRRGGAGNFANNPQRAAEAGRKGGQMSGGNFAKDRERAAEAGRLGGRHSHGGGRTPASAATQPTTPPQNA
jgi:general stress protein YciG